MKENSLIELTVNGDSIESQNFRAMIDSIGVCLFPVLDISCEEPIMSIFSAVTGIEYDRGGFLKARERVFNLEKLFNYREGFRIENDWLPDRFFEDTFTTVPKNWAVLDRSTFIDMLTSILQIKRLE